jgi:transglutaminase-like putative cysteine protease
MRLRATCSAMLDVREATPLVAMLRPRSDHSQWILEDTYHVEPFVKPLEYLDLFGNLCQRFVAPKGSLSLRVSCLAEVDEHVPVADDARAVPIAELPSSALQYLLPSRYCPADKLSELAQEIVRDVPPGYRRVAAIARHVHDRLDYKYGVSSASSDALDTLEAGAGVCRDFAHVSVTLCRAVEIPARVVAGYLHSLEPQDLHCWFEAFVGDRWYTFDATEDRLLGGRIVIARGRDAADVAFISEFGPLEMKSLQVALEKLG